jgi:formamidase
LTTPNELTHAVQHVLKLISKALNGYANLDMIVFPEYMLHGLSMSTDDRITCTLDRPEVKTLQAKCKEHKVWGCFITMEKNALLPSAPWNTGIVINDNGELVNYYRKMHPWIPVEPWYPGNGGILTSPALVVCSCRTSSATTGSSPRWRRNPNTRMLKS